MSYRKIFLMVLVFVLSIGMILLSNTEKSGGHNEVFLRLSDANSVEDLTRLQDSLLRDPGIKGVEIHAQEHQLTIIYNPQQITQKDILHLVEKAGFQGSLEDRSVSRRRETPRGCCPF